jgi:hypothetical protein
VIQLSPSLYCLYLLCFNFLFIISLFFPFPFLNWIQSEHQIDYVCCFWLLGFVSFASFYCGLGVHVVVTHFFSVFCWELNLSLSSSVLVVNSFVISSKNFLPHAKFNVSIRIIGLWGLGSSFVIVRDDLWDLSGQIKIRLFNHLSSQVGLISSFL